MWYFSITFSQMITLISKLFVDRWGSVSMIFWHCSRQMGGDPVHRDMTELTASKPSTGTSDHWTVVRLLVASASREFILSSMLFISLISPYSHRFFFSQTVIILQLFSSLSCIVWGLCRIFSSSVIKVTDTVYRDAPSIHWLNFINRSLSIQRDLQK